MSGKKVSDLIIDKLSESIKQDSVFEGISKDLTDEIKEESCAKNNLINLLKKKQNENTGTGN